MIYIYRQNASACCNLTRSVIQKFSIIELKFTDLECHVIYNGIKIITKDSEISLHWLDWSREIKVKTHFNKDLCFKINEFLFIYILLLIFGQALNHPCKRWRNWLFQLSWHQNANGCKMEHLRPWKVMIANHVDVSVKNTSCDEECFYFVVFLWVKVENLLDPIGSIFFTE